MSPDWVSNPGSLALESDALPTELRGPAGGCSIRVYIVCHSICIFWKNHCILKPNYSISNHFRCLNFDNFMVFLFTFIFSGSDRRNCQGCLQQDHCTML